MGAYDGGLDLYDFEYRFGYLDIRIFSTFKAMAHSQYAKVNPNKGKLSKPSPKYPVKHECGSSPTGTCESDSQNADFPDRRQDVIQFASSTTLVDGSNNSVARQSLEVSVEPAKLEESFLEGDVKTIERVDAAEDVPLLAVERDNRASEWSSDLKRNEVYESGSDRGIVGTIVEEVICDETNEFLPESVVAPLSLQHKGGQETSDEGFDITSDDFKSVSLLRPPGSLRIIRKIGEGGSGSVYLVREKASQDEKVLKVVKHFEDSLLHRVDREKLAFEKAQGCAQLVQLFSCDEFPDCTRFFMEKLDRDLKSHIEDECPSAEAFKFITFQMVKGIQFLHKKGIMHRDIKPENVFVRESEGRVKSVKLGDFGLCVKANVIREKVGTNFFMAPEVIQGTFSYNNSVDWFSFGATLYNLVEDEYLYSSCKTDKSLLKAIKRNSPEFTTDRRIRLSETFNDFVRQLVKATGRLGSGDRDGAKFVLRHPFLADIPECWSDNEFVPSQIQADAFLSDDDEMSDKTESLLELDDGSPLITFVENHEIPPRSPITAWTPSVTEVDDVNLIRTDSNGKYLENNYQQYLSNKDDNAKSDEDLPALQDNAMDNVHALVVEQNYSQMFADLLNDEGVNSPIVEDDHFEHFKDGVFDVPATLVETGHFTEPNSVVENTLTERRLHHPAATAWEDNENSADVGRTDLQDHISLPLAVGEKPIAFDLEEDLKPIVDEPIGCYYSELLLGLELWADSCCCCLDEHDQRPPASVESLGDDPIADNASVAMLGLTESTEIYCDANTLLTDALACSSSENDRLLAANTDITPDFPANCQAEDSGKDSDIKLKGVIPQEINEKKVGRWFIDFVLLMISTGILAWLSFF
ncbi:hypothetical protein HDU97_010208 [Phlyctochytrium planicorne]|nr:hypothetical protein HDU97_010208 [Phlyctochytrium planicorne]